MPSLPLLVKITVCRIIIVPVILHSCETWSVSLREHQSLRESAGEVLRVVFGIKWQEVTGDWEFHDLNCSQNIISVTLCGRMRWAGHVANVEEDSNAYMILVEKYKGKSPLGRFRCG